MALRPLFRRSFALVGALLLLGLAWTGIVGGVQQLSRPATVLQHVQSVSQVVFGASAILMLVTAFTWRQLAVIAETGFVVGLVVAAGLAAVVWGGESVGIGVVAGVVALAIAAVLVWMIRMGRSATPIDKAGEPREA